ncbi:LuxR C-terminal-related transcriptional regulator [Nesterenkonia halotolerans]|uniref:helix-turn-helix transcriptional regulator n=1 Tax=Nesterenkonia halotolerans TaxID=225325 RepID=UPI003EE4A954
MSTEGPRVGREQELALIRQAARQAAERRAQFVYLEGFAGVGKGTLMRDALEVFEDWREIVVVLDQEQSEISGDLLRRLVLPPETQLCGQSVDELVAEGLQRAQILRRPTVVALINTQWIDSESAEALLRICTMLRDAAVLVVMSGRPSARPEVNRLSAFARNSPNGTYIRVDPFRPAETKELLAQYLTTPLSAGVVDTVQTQTAGYPLLVHEVGRHLAATSIGTRRLAMSISTTKAGPAAQWMRRAFEEALVPLTEETREVLRLLAVSSVPLAKHQIAFALDSPADLSDVLESGLAAWDERLFGYKIRNGLITEALLALMCPKELAELHRKLIDIVDGTAALTHRVEIARVLPDSEPISELIHDLRDAAADSLLRGDLEQAFQHFLAVTSLKANAQALQDLLYFGAILGHLDCFPPYESSLRCLKPGPLRQGGLALVALDRDDLPEAVAALERQARVDPEDPAALVFAQAVALVAADLGIMGTPGRAEAAKRETLRMLAVREEHLDQRLASQDLVHVPREALEWERAHAAGLSAFIQLWQVFDAQDPRTVQEAEAEISREIQRLEQIPNSEAFQVGLKSARGARRRYLGDPVGAYADLSVVMAVSPDMTFLTFAKAQLARVLFTAGLWEEAMDVAAAATDSALLRREDATALVAYLTWALIPISRGRSADVAPMIEEISAVRKDAGVLVSSALEHLYAWTAVVDADHERAVRHLLRLRDEAGGWMNVGIDAVLLLVRAAHYAGLSSMIPSLQRVVQAGDCPVAPQLEGSVLDYMEGFQAWEKHDPTEAMRRFARVDEWLEAQPPMHLTQQFSDAGGFRLFRAFTYLDMGALVIAYPQELKRNRVTVIEGLEWSIALFTRVGSPGLLQLAVEELSALRPRLDRNAPLKRVPHVQGPSSALTSAGIIPTLKPEVFRENVAKDHTGPLDGLSGRERQVAVLIADGWTNKEIAEELGVSVRTIDFHVRNALTKFDVSSRHEIRHRLRHRTVGG